MSSSKYSVASSFHSPRFHLFGLECVNFVNRSCHNLPIIACVFWATFSQHILAATTCTYMYLLGGLTWIFFGLVLFCVILYSFLVPVPIYLHVKHGQIERSEQDRSWAVTIPHMAIRSFLFVSFAMMYGNGEPLLCLAGVTNPCPSCWGLSGLILLALFVLVQEVVRCLVRRRSERVASQGGKRPTLGGIDGSAQLEPKYDVDEEDWLDDVNSARTVQLYRRVAELAEIVQAASDSIPSLAIWVHVVVIAYGNFSCTSPMSTLFHIHIWVLTGVTLVWRVLYYIWMYRCHVSTPSSVRWIRASHLLLSPLLFWFVSGYLTIPPAATVCWVGSQTQVVVFYILAGVTFIVSVTERTLLIIYATPVREFGSQTRLVDTIIAGQDNKLYLRPPTRMYPHVHWGGAIIKAPNDEEIGVVATSQTSDSEPDV